MELTLVQTIAVSAIPIIFAITVHEASHGYVAKYFGDLTADKMGRITLNPLKHIDPIGTILLPILTYLFVNFPIGYAKPVPVNFAGLRNPKKDMLWVAAAGPASNFMMAIFWALVLKYVQLAPDYAAYFLLEMSKVGIMINLVLMVLNLIPMPPLDGGRIAVSLLPIDLAVKYSRFEPYGMILIFLLLMTGILGPIMLPIINFFGQLILGIFA